MFEMMIIIISIRKTIVVDLGGCDAAIVSNIDNTSALVTDFEIRATFVILSNIYVYFNKMLRLSVIYSGS